MIEGIIVDAGHGGIDSGAVGNNLLEKDLTLKAATYMYQRLKELGIPTKITRDNDEYLPKDERIRRIKNLYNNSPNTILVSNHINAGGGEGAEVVYSLKNNSTLADLVLNNIGEAGQIKRKAYQRRLPESPNKDYYYILRETGNTEPILVEYGFIDNQRDATKLRNNLEDYVEAVVKALAEYTGYPYTPPTITPTTVEYYTVQRGDTLYSISRKFNVPVDRIKEINNLTSNNISIGQRIYLTDNNEPTTNNNYIVKRGDTLYSIARDNNISVEELKRINNITNNNIYPGQELIINIMEDQNGDIEDNNYTIYIVKKGDSLWKISREFDIPVNELIEINNLKDINLKIGDSLLVPNIEVVNDTYIVQRGDTLWSVAREFGIDVNTLKELNNLESNLLTIGQELKIK